MQTQASPTNQQTETFDFVIIGSGFGGSVSAMRLTQKGYRVLVLERGKRYRDEDFARTNWNIWKWLWLPALRCFGIFQMTLLKNVLVLHGNGVGGGSLGYANVLLEPDDELFENPAWSTFADWKVTLRPHYNTARRMLGVSTNPRLWPADEALKDVAEEMERGSDFRPTEVGVFFNPNGGEGELVSDPYFGGEGPPRAGCTHCGACMVGCRYNAKNTLVKNYLYFAEKWGAEVRAEALVSDIRPLKDQYDGARYEIAYHRTTAWFFKPTRRVRARNVVVAAGVLGSLKLLFHCRDANRSLPDISTRLGEVVRTNSEELIGVTSSAKHIDYSEGIAITSIFHADDVTHIEPVRYSDGSSLIRLLAAPLIEANGSFPARVLRMTWEVVRRPLRFLDAKFLARWARRSTIFLVMQSADNLMRLKLGRSLLTFFRRGLVSEGDTKRPIPVRIDVGHQVTNAFAKRTDGLSQGTFYQGLFNIPTTAHIIGGCPFGRDADEGVIGLNCEVHRYPGLYVVDGSIIPANPGVNPSLTIAALAEYAMSHMPPKDGKMQRQLSFDVTVPQTTRTVS